MARIALSLAALLLLLGIPASAQENKGELFLGYSLFRANPATSGFDSFTLNGASASGAYHFNDTFSLVGDFGGYHNGNILNSGFEGTIYTYMIGPRASYHGFERLTPFAQVLLGGAHATDNTFGTGSEHAFAWSVGGGIDAKLNDKFSVRIAQVDYLMTRFGEFPNPSQARTQNNFRFSAGVVFHF